jgi:DNA-directed RNA polymerase subunit RPC12/RpoP
MQDDVVSIPQLNKSTKDGSWLWMWIAHYDDGTSLPQYDPYTLETHIFDEVNQDKLIKFGLYPFPKSLATRLREEKGILVRSNVFLPKYEVNIDKGKRVIGALTTNFIKTIHYIYCPKCKKWMNSRKFNYINIGGNVKTYRCSICGTQTYWKCKKCGKTYNHINETNNWKCTNCDSKVSGNRVQFHKDSIIERWRIYKLGYQQTIKGINQKTIMEISENGDVDLTYK